MSAPGFYLGARRFIKEFTFGLLLFVILKSYLSSLSSHAALIFAVLFNILTLDFVHRVKYWNIFYTLGFLFVAYIFRTFLSSFDAIIYIVIVGAYLLKKIRIF